MTQIVLGLRGGAGRVKWSTGLENKAMTLRYQSLPPDVSLICCAFGNIIQRNAPTMDMRTRVNTALKDAMRAKESERLATLRLINAAIKDRDIALRGEGGDDATVGDSDVLAIMGRMVKQRQESARAYDEGGRLELAEKERSEIKVIEEFLPKQLSEAEVESAIAVAIEETGAESIRDMGKVMGVLKSKYTGQMDFGKTGPMVKQKLG